MYPAAKSTNINNTKYKHNSYFYCAPYSLTDGALQKSANTCFTAVGRLK